MTTSQEQQYAAAIERAHARGVRYVGRGVRRADEARIYTVTSASESNRLHIVAREGDTLVCDCTAAQNGRYCMHRAIVREALEAEREARRAVRVAQAIVTAPAPVAPAPVAQPWTPESPKAMSRSAISLWR